MDNTNSEKQDKQSQQNKGKQKSGEEGILTLLQPHDMSKTVESAMHVVQGRHEKLPDLMYDLGTVILKAARRMTTTQLILAAGALTIGAVLLARYSSENDEFAIS